MKLATIKPGDIVRCNKKGRLFHATVTGAGAGGVLIVSPIERNVSYRHITATEIAEHWSHTVVTRRLDRRPSTPTALDLDAASTGAIASTNGHAGCLPDDEQRPAIPASMSD